MKQSTDLLNELIEIARDGRRFYLEAAGKVTTPEVHKVFMTQAGAHKQLINDLSQYVQTQGEAVSKDETLAGRTRKLYADVLAKVSSDQERVYIKQLQEVENRLLHNYRQALQEADSEEARRVLMGHMPTVQAAHERMKILRQKKLAA